MRVLIRLLALMSLLSLSPALLAGDTDRPMQPPRGAEIAPFGTSVPRPEIVHRPRVIPPTRSERAAGTVWHVSVLGSDGNTGLSWNQAFASPQVALAAAQPGDEVWLEALEFDTLNPADPNDSYVIPAGVTVRGGFEGRVFGGFETDPSQRALTIPTKLLGAVNGLGEPQTYHTGRIENVAGVVLDRLNFARGSAKGGSANSSDNGGGLLVLNSEVRFCDVDVSENMALSSGGGLYALLSDLTIMPSTRGSQISLKSRNNSCVTDGDSPSFGGSFTLVGGTLTMEAGTGIGLEGTSSANYGGMLAIQDVAVTAGEDAIIAVNNGSTAQAVQFDPGTGFIEAGQGGGVYIVMTDTLSTVTLPKVELTQCDALFGGGLAVFGFTSQPATLQIRELNAFDCSAITSGGGMYFAGTPMVEAELQTATILICDAVFGGGVFVTNPIRILGGSLRLNTAGFGGSLYTTNLESNPINILLQDVEVRTGSSPTNTGLWHGALGLLELNRCAFRGSPANGTDGGMLNTGLDTRVRMENCLFTGHAAGFPLRIGNDAEILANHVTIAGNFEGVASLLSGSSLDLLNSILYYNIPGDEGIVAQSGANVTLQYCIADNFDFSLPNVVTNVDPLLDPITFEPLPGSPAIDVSTGSFPLFGDNLFDLLGNPRAVDDPGISDRGVPHLVYGVQADFGAFEFQPPVCQADINGDGVLDNGDIIAFVQAFLAQDIAADFNADGILDNGDIGAFVAAFLAGC